MVKIKMLIMCSLLLTFIAMVPITLSNPQYEDPLKLIVSTKNASGGGATGVENTTVFSVESAQTPPQASFTYSPLEPYVNMTITFDALASTAEGYNDTIVKYEWDFGDGTPKVVETTPTTTHVFASVDTYIVTLNVTDSEGLWSTTSEPITTLPPTGPTADFIWYPSTPIVNQTVTFDATPQH